MNLTLCTMNVRGSNDPAKLKKLRNYLQILQPAPDILLLQEHKLTSANAADLGRQLNPRATYIFSEASQGYGHSERGEGAGCGGTTILIHNRLDRFIINSGSLHQGRVLWVILGNLPGGPWGFINIYNSTDARKRRQLWLQLPESLPENCKWFFGGDFNMVESSADKSSMCGRLVGDQERIAWDSLKSTLSIEDTFLPRQSLRFSWDNGRLQGERILARLDRIYTPKQRAGQHLKILSYRILGGCAISDHLPVVMQVNLASGPTSPRYWKMNSRFIQETSEEVKRIWLAQPPNATFFTKLRKVIHFYREYSKKKAEERRAAEIDLRQRLSVAHGKLQEDPCSFPIQFEVATIREQLLEFERLKAEGQRIRSRVKWKDKGDGCNREFFQMVREQPKTQAIAKLKDEDGTLYSEDKELQRICQRFYQKLYETPPPLPLE